MLVDLLKSAEDQKLCMVSKKIKFTHLESESIQDSMTERSDAGDRKFIIALNA